MYISWNNIQEFFFLITKILRTFFEDKGIFKKINVWKDFKKIFREFLEIK